MQQGFTNIPGNTGTVIYKGNGGNYNNIMDVGPRGPLPQPTNDDNDEVIERPGNTKDGSINVPLTSCLTRLN
jgi:hypothetical protein